VVSSSPSNLTLADSSLFGVIHFQDAGSGAAAGSPAGEPDFRFAVDSLTVVFNNSKITEFSVKVGLTILRLFGREVELVSSPQPSPPPADTLVIAGRYQSQAGVGTVTFVSDDPFEFRFTTPSGVSRVLERVQFTGAALVPVGSTPAGSPGSTRVVARFALGGELWFRADPFPAADRLDLFSYGLPDSPPGPNQGLPFSGLTVQLAFTLDPEGVLEPGSESLTFEPELLALAPASGAIRPGSLLYSLPLKYVGFLASATGLSPAALGAQPVHCLQLEGAGQGSPPPQAAPAPAITASPLYALEYELPLGSVGSLSSVHAAFVARLFLAWGPSQVVPDDDGAALLVQLPQLEAGYQGFDLQGILKTTFGAANLLQVELGERGTVYAVLFNNVALSVFGYDFPPGLMVDFLLFAGTPAAGGPTNTSNLAWLLAATQSPGSAGGP
jgi:hypothetical protein